MPVRVSKSVLWKAIKEQCIECMGGQQYLVAGCTAPKCSLYPFRSGNSRKVVVTPEMEPERRKGGWQTR
jgi:hypothetical protein